MTLALLPFFEIGETEGRDILKTAFVATFNLLLHYDNIAQAYDFFFS